jgi:hypothetical protein
VRRTDWWKSASTLTKAVIGLVHLTELTEHEFVRRHFVLDATHVLAENEKLTFEEYDV